MSNKDDCINRRDVIDAMKDMYRAAEKWLRDATDDVTKARAESCMASLVEIKLRTEKLPAVQPDHTADVSKKVSISCGQENDLISRQAARHALCKAVHNGEDIPCENQTASCLWTGTRVCDYVREIDALPPVQPERVCVANVTLTEYPKVIRCKNCKFSHMTNDGRYCKYCDMFTDDYGQLIEMYFESNFYCGYAERKINERTG